MISSETRALTPDLAAEFSQMKASVTERDLDPKRCKFLQETILNGIVLPFQWAKVTVLADGQCYRVNGHHSSHVLAGMNGTMPEGLWAHIDHWEVPNVEATPDLFRQIDNRRSARSLGDISGAFQMVEPALILVPRKAGRRAIEGAAWWLRYILGAPVPLGEDIFSMFHDARYHPFVLFGGGVLSFKTLEFTVPVVGAMFGTFEKSPVHAEEFWQAVAKQGGGFDEKHPATVLDAWLCVVKDAKDKKPVGMEIYRACTLAWNAYRNNRNLDRIGRYDPKKGWPELE